MVSLREVALENAARRHELARVIREQMAVLRRRIEVARAIERSSAEEAALTEEPYRAYRENSSRIAHEQQWILERELRSLEGEAEKAESAANAATARAEGER